MFDVGWSELLIIAVVLIVLVVSEGFAADVAAFER